MLPWLGIEGRSLFLIIQKIMQLLQKVLNRKYLSSNARCIYTCNYIYFFRSSKCLKVCQYVSLLLAAGVGVLALLPNPIDPISFEYVKL